MRRIRIVAWTAVALLLVAVGLAYLLRPNAGNLSLPLSARIGGPFELTTHEGRRMSSAELKGKPFAVFFGFTHCPDVCPTTLLELTSLIKRMGPDADRMGYLFITVDPERDTPEQMKLYMSTFDPRIVGLTGTPEEIASVARAYGVFYQRVPTKNGFTYNHTATVHLMGKDGHRVGTLADKEPEDVRVKKLQRLIGLS